VGVDVGRGGVGWGAYVLAVDRHQQHGAGAGAHRHLHLHGLPPHGRGVHVAAGSSLGHVHGHLQTPPRPSGPLHRRA
jgi:hypothetical protein